MIYFAISDVGTAWVLGVMLLAWLSVGGTLAVVVSAWELFLLAALA